MKNDELNLSELDNVLSGNAYQSQIISSATMLYEQGYSNQEVKMILSKSYNLNDESVINIIDSLGMKYSIQEEPVSKQR